MECNVETFKLFSNNKCGMISMDGKEKQVYDTPSGDMSKNVFNYEEIYKNEQNFYEKIEADDINTNTNTNEWEDYIYDILYTHDCVYNNCQLTFKDWCIKHDYKTEK